MLKNILNNKPLITSALVIIGGILAIFTINIYITKSNLETINFQNKLVETLGDYENFQNETILLDDFRLNDFKSKNKILARWINTKNDFINNFNVLIEINNSKGIYEDIYKQLIFVIDNETAIVEWKIVDLLQQETNNKENEYNKVQINDLMTSIKNLNLLLTESLTVDMNNLYVMMSEYQKKSYINRSKITIITSILIILFMLFVLYTAIKSYRNKELEFLDKSNKTLDVTLKILAYQVELRDSLTSMHLIRASKYVIIISKELAKIEKFKEEITENFVTNLEKASVLHDIGKIGIPDNILNKKGKLTYDEYEVVKKHCKYGGDILRLAKNELPFETFLDIAIRVTESHHEHWDGNGYPNKLMGENIPLCGRIMAIADVYDALRAKRVYKDGLDHSTCLEYIINRKGSQFDPYIVDAFHKINLEIEKISNED